MAVAAAEQLNVCMVLCQVHPLEAMHSATAAVQGRYDNTLYVCDRALNRWLDAADDDPRLEPLAVSWFRP